MGFSVGVGVGLGVGLGVSAGALLGLGFCVDAGLLTPVLGLLVWVFVLGLLGLFPASPLGLDAGPSSGASLPLFSGTLPMGRLISKPEALSAAP